MKDLNIKQILAVFLAAVMLLSNIPVAAFAQEQTYCGLDHEHVEACYIDPDGETPTDPEETDPEETDPEETDPEETDPEETDPEETDPEETDPEETDPEETEPEVTEPEETDPEETEPEVTEPEVTEPEVTEPEVTEPEVTEPEVTEPEVTEPEVTEPEVTEPEVTEPEKSLYEKLMAAETVQELCDLLAGDKTGAAALTAAELAAVKSRVESLYGKLEAPAEAEKAAYEQIIRTVTELEAALQDEEEDDPTEPEVTEPEVTEPEVTEPEVTEPEVTEPEVTEPEVTEPEVTEPEVTEPEVTEPEVTEPEETEPEKSLREKLLETVSLQDFHDLLMADTAVTYALTAEELAAVKAHAEALYTVLEEPTEDEADFYELTIGTIEYLNGLLQEEIEEETIPVILDEPAANTVYFDLSLGDVTIDGSGNVSGKVWRLLSDGTYTEHTYPNLTHSSSTIYYVFQSSGDKKGYISLNDSGDIDGVIYPDYSSYNTLSSNWRSYISQYQPVADVISSWNTYAGNTGRTSTGNRIHVSGSSSYQFVVSDIWSSYTETGSNRTKSSITFVPGTNGTMDLSFKGDNRLEGIHFNGSTAYRNGQGTRINIHGGSTDTLTVAYSGSSSALYHAAIGAGHGQRAKTIQISGGIVYAGVESSENATAIGGGANYAADVIITGGTVTAVNKSNGTAIGGGFGGSSGFPNDKETSVTIKGGIVRAYNLGNGAAIGAGSTTGAAVGNATITITGGSVTAETKGIGPAIGGGNGSSAAGSANITIDGGSVTATTAGTFALGAGVTNSGAEGSTIISLAPGVTVDGTHTKEKTVVYHNASSNVLRTFHLNNNATPEYTAPADPNYDGFTFIEWNTKQDGTGSTWSSTLVNDVTNYYPIWAIVTFTGTIYFDLSLGNVSINNSRYLGSIYVPHLGKAVSISGEHKPENVYYVYQSGSSPVGTGVDDDGVTVTLPNHSRIDGWAGTITNNNNVKNVVSAWTSKADKAGRTPTKNHIEVSGSSTFNVTIDDIWSNYIQSTNVRSAGSVTFLASGSGHLKLTFVDDNRLDNLYYRSTSSSALTISGKAGTDTLTVAATNAGGNYWSSAIGSDDGSKHVYNLSITGGTVFAGTHGEDNCTAIGGGGNGYGHVTISGGTVTAVASTSGTAIGGGIGYHGGGGNAKVTIQGSGTKVYAYNHGIVLMDTGIYNGQLFAVPAVAIGGGSSVESSGNDSTVVNIYGGTVYAQSIYGAAIGGGGSSTQHGGSATVNISGGTVIARSIPGTLLGYNGADGHNNSGVSREVSAGVSIGGGTGMRSGGYAELNISGSAIVKTGSIGGGKASDTYPLGYAKVTISGGTTQGQVIMQETGEEGVKCSFTMNGGLLDNTYHKQTTGNSFSDGAYTYYFLEENGGAVCMKDPIGETKISGGTIQNCRGIMGGAVYMSGGSFTMTDGTIQNCSATENGGAVYLGAGNVSISGGSIGSQDNGNSAQNGGAVYVNGGDVHLSGGSILHNTAEVNGGGIAVNNGAVYMSGGSVSGNKASSGAGGGIYASSTGTNDVAVKVYSGTLSGNAAATSGGAVAVRGESGTITVQTGVNENHNPLPFSHTENEGTYTHASCPQIKNNSSGSSGGAFYISGNSETRLNIFCLEDEGNTAGGDMNPLNEHMSTFLMVEGGVVYLSTSTRYDDIAGTPNLTPGGDDASGKLSVSGTIHVISGVLELFGSKDNPRLEGALTIDLQSSDDRYIDHRGSESKVTVSYHENFYRPDGTPDSAQTAFDIQNGMTHQIYGGLYAHEGYKLYGWNTKKDANPSTETEGWYNAQDVYIFHVAGNGHADGTREGSDHYGNLTLYAIWKSNGYDVKYVSGVPEDHEWSGADKTETRTYDVPFNLPTNWFVWPGHVFDGWKLPDGSVKQPGAKVLNLTSEQGATVTVTAQWKDCSHPDEQVVFTGSEDTLTKTCHLCGLSATAKLTAQDAVYDGARHEATLECSDAAFWNPTVNYVGVTIAPQEVPQDWQPQAVAVSCVSAGNYTASITGGESTVSVEYTIAKAKQSAPQTRPTYIRPTDDSDIVTINLLPDNEKISSESGAEAVYYVRYYDNGTQVTETAEDTKLAESGIQHKLTKALTTYAVLVNYPETDNYLPSDYITAETTFVFAGKLHLTIKAEEGIDFWPGNTQEGQMSIHVKLRDGYFLTGSDFEFNKQVTQGEYDIDKLKINWNQQDEYVIGAETATTETYITITIRGVKKSATITGYAKEKQHFSDFSGSDSIAISRDSAFTARFDIANYDAADYAEPCLTFSPALPAGTTIILRDRSDGSYWYITASGNTVSLTSFKKMVTNGTYTLRSNMELQFIVDFSRCSETISGTSLECTFSAPKKTETSMAAVLTKTLKIALDNAGLSLGSVDGAGLTQSVQITSGAGAAASKYDHRDVALVLTPKNPLPKDVYIQMNLNGVNSTWRPDRSGKFFISLGNYQSMNTQIGLELISGMFPMEPITYKVDAQLYLSASDAETAPLNGDQCKQVELKFTSDRERTGIDISVANDQRLFTTADSITATVRVLPGYIETYYNVVVELHQEFDDSTFGNTTITPQYNSSQSAYTFNLAGIPTGDYCIVASLQTKNGYVLNEARYYFIIHPTEEAGTNP